MLIIVLQIHSLLGGAVCGELVAPFHRNNHHHIYNQRY